MKYVDALLQDKKYMTACKQLLVLEQNRSYCGHSMEHFLSVARIAQLINLEYDLQIEKEIIYLSALLHDIGRVEEYTNKISHEEASVVFSREILLRLGYDEKKTEVILWAILHHRGRIKQREIENHIQMIKQQKEIKNKLAMLICISDQQARNCFCCDMNDTCKWESDEKLVTTER